LGREGRAAARPASRVTRARVGEVAVGDSWRSEASSGWWGAKVWRVKKMRWRQVTLKVRSMVGSWAGTGWGGFTVRGRTGRVAGVG
jgi:hypothetical protein